MSEAIAVVIVLGVLMGGSILVIDSMIIRRLRRSRDEEDQEGRQ